MYSRVNGTCVTSGGGRYFWMGGQIKYCHPSQRGALKKSEALLEKSLIFCMSPILYSHFACPLDETRASHHSFAGEHAATPAPPYHTCPINTGVAMINTYLYLYFVFVFYSDRQQVQ